MAAVALRWPLYILELWACIQTTPLTQVPEATACTGGLGPLIALSSDVGSVTLEAGFACAVSLPAVV